MTQFGQDPKVLHPAVGLAIITLSALGLFSLPDFVSGSALEAVVPDASESLHNWVYRLTAVPSLVGLGFVAHNTLKKMGY